MSGSTRVELTSEYFQLSTESPCMNFHFNPDDPGFETRWHQKWKEKGYAWLQRLKPILEQRFAMLAAQPDPERPLVRYEERFPLWNPYHAPEEPPPWRVRFVGMSGPGISHVTVAFSQMPTEAARERFKLELVKDVAMLDPKEGVI